MTTTQAPEALTMPAHPESSDRLREILRGLSGGVKASGIFYGWTGRGDLVLPNDMAKSIITELLSLRTTGKAVATGSMTSVTEEMIEALKPCPFCGEGEDVYAIAFNHTLGDPSHVVRCLNCGALGGEDADKDAAIEAWNRRASPALEAALSASPAAQTEVGKGDWLSRFTVENCNFAALDSAVGVLRTGLASRGGNYQTSLWAAIVDYVERAAPSAPQPTEPVADAREIEANLRARQRVAFRKALAELPEIAPPEVARLLSSVHMRDEFLAEGKRLQIEHGLDAVAPRVEQECGAGAWSFMRQGVLSALVSPVAQQRDEVIEECAKIADSWVGTEDGLAARATQEDAKLQHSLMADFGRDIADAIRVLSPERKDKSNG